MKIKQPTKPPKPSPNLILNMPALFHGLRLMTSSILSHSKVAGYMLDDLEVFPFNEKQASEVRAARKLMSFIDGMEKELVSYELPSKKKRRKKK